MKQAKQFKEWADWMVGKHVRNKCDGDVGIINRYEAVNNQVWVDWKTGRDEGDCLWVNLSEIEFIDANTHVIIEAVPIEIEYMGRRYILKED